jgi:copper resistance protein D
MVTTLIITRAIHIGASILIAGIFTFDLVTLGLTGQPESNDLYEFEPRLFRLAFWSLIAALLSALLWFWLEVASMSELSLKNTFSATAWWPVLFETQFGRVWQLRLGVIAAVFVAVVSGRAQIKARRMLIWVPWLLSIAFLVSLAWISHAAARVHPLGLFSDVVHLCAAGAWIGGLVPLTLFLGCASFSLGQTVVSVLLRFSMLSLCCVSVLIVTGISNSWLLVGSLHALFTTPYGRLLLLKLTLFGILIGFGARNRFLVKARLRKGSANPDLLSQLRRNVLCEVCLGVAIVLIVACLGVTPPARFQ